MRGAGLKADHDACEICRSGLEWVTRGHCGPWPDWLRILYMSSNYAITAAYIAIACILAGAALLEGFRALPTDSTTRDERLTALSTYAIFILACGIGHLEGVVSFFWPAYPLFAVWHLFTAEVSLFAVHVTWQHRLRIVRSLL